MDPDIRYPEVARNPDGTIRMQEIESKSDIEDVPADAILDEDEDAPKVPTQYATQTKITPEQHVLNQKRAIQEMIKQAAEEQANKASLKDAPPPDTEYVEETNKKYICAREKARQVLFCDVLSEYGKLRNYPDKYRELIRSLEEKDEALKVLQKQVDRFEDQEIATDFKLDDAKEKVEELTTKFTKLDQTHAELVVSNQRACARSWRNMFMYFAYVLYTIFLVPRVHGYLIDDPHFMEVHGFWITTQMVAFAGLLVVVDYQF